LNFNSTAFVHNRLAASSRDARLHHSTRRDFLTYPITEPWQCYRSGSVNILCKIW